MSAAYDHVSTDVVMSEAPSTGPLKILVLADRDWSHPQGGGSGVNIHEQVTRWAQWGHQVTIVSGEYPGAERYEELAENLVVHRMGGRATVFPRAVWAVMRGVGRDADVVLEVINGIAFLTPLWLRKPRIALVHHPHRDLYIGEFGRWLGRALAALLEEWPLRLLYRRTRFLTISKSARDELVTIDGVPHDHVTVTYCGIDPGVLRPRDRSPQPRLVYVGRLKKYKRIDHVLDVLEAVPEASLDIVGEGDYRTSFGASIVADIERRGLTDRVHMHGFVDEERKAELYASAWVHLTASSSEGWSLTVIEAALCGTPSAALAVGGLRESIVDGETGVLARDVDQLTERVRELIDDHELRERLGRAAAERAATFDWDTTARTNLDLLRAAIPVAQARATVAA